MKKSGKERVLVVCNSTGPTKIDQDFSKELRTEDWETENDVLKALRTLGHDCDLLGVFDSTDVITEKIRRYCPNIIFNLVERFKGEAAYDRDIASFFELLGVPFTGSGTTGLTLSKNKGISKKILSYHKIRVPAFVILHHGKPVHRPSRLHFPIFIKPLSEEASLGISQASFVENDDQFIERVRFIHETMGQDAIAEEYIDGRELYVSVLGNKQLRVFPIREMKFSQVPEDEPKFASYKAKWDKAYRKRWGIRNQFAGGLTEGTEEKIKKLCRKIYRLLCIRGYARFDLRLTSEDEIVFIEANPNPILSECEDFAVSARKGGVPYPQMIQKILNLSVARNGY
ncbi:MAG: ATP-grasp domain-containing protein [Candidatus Omnitrophota bacterium]|nr:ATP-grasp domain-containing protein [Candidatus Omnitrophota bacterium]